MKRILIILALLPTLARPETAVQHLLEEKMYARIQKLDDSLHGVLGVASIDLSSGRIFSYNGDAVFPTASSIKIPIMAEMFRSHIDLSRQITIQPREAAGGSGNLQNQLKQGPVTLNVRELITAMIEHSDNTATNQCIALIGRDSVNKMLAGLGFRATRLRRVMMDTAAAARGDENVSTPLEMARFVELLYGNKLTGAAATTEMIDILKLVKADMRKAIPAGIEVAAKPGDLTGVHAETGIVYLPNRPFILSVFSTFLDQNVNPVEDVTRIAFDYFRKLAESNPYGNKVK